MCGHLGWSLMEWLRIALSQDWQQIAVYHRGRDADPGTLVISVVATFDEPLEHSFLVRNPEIKLFTVQTPLQ